MAKDLIPGIVENIPAWALPMIEGTDDEALTSDQLDMLDNWLLSNNIDDIAPVWYQDEELRHQYFANPQFGEGPCMCFTCYVLRLDR